MGSPKTKPLQPSVGHHAPACALPLALRQQLVSYTDSEPGISTPLTPQKQPGRSGPGCTITQSCNHPHQSSFFRIINQQLQQRHKHLQEASPDHITTYSTAISFPTCYSKARRCSSRVCRTNAHQIGAIFDTQHKEGPLNPSSQKKHAG